MKKSPSPVFARCALSALVVALVLVSFGQSAFASSQGWLRPDCPPIGDREIQLARQLEQTYATQSQLPLVTASDSQGDVVPNQYVVSYCPGGEAAARNAVGDAGGTVIRTSRMGGDFLVVEFGAPDPAKRQMALSSLRSTIVGYVSPVMRYHACLVPNDPYYVTNEWDKYVMYSDRAWDLTTGSREIKVAVVDEGIDYNHPDLSADFDANRRGYNFVDGNTDPHPVTDSEAHATHVAGIIAATINNSIGVAGWAAVTLYSCRALDSSGTGSDVDIADAMHWAVDTAGARIINLSLGSNTPDPVMQQAVDYVWSKGALVFAASGNEAASGIYFPARYPNAVAVGALGVNGQVASFSNWGPEMGVIAPGEMILSTVPSNRYELMQGTSMATPQVSGVAALLLSYKPLLTNSQVRAILEASAVDLYPMGFDAYSGYGLVNAWRALQLADIIVQDRMLDEPRLTICNSRPALPAVVRRGRQILLEVDTHLQSSNGSPDWACFDVHGRMVRSGSGALRVDLVPGVYFVRALSAPESGSPARKLIVVP